MYLAKMELLSKVKRKLEAGEFTLQKNNEGKSEVWANFNFVVNRDKISVGTINAISL